MKTPHNYAKDLIRHHILTRRAHLAEQTGAPRNMHKRIRFRAYLSASQRKMDPREVNYGVHSLGRPNLNDLPSMCTSRKSNCHAS